MKTKRIMAKPIKETPVLTGDDATRFAQSAHEVVPASQKRCCWKNKPTHLSYTILNLLTGGFLQHYET